MAGIDKKAADEAFATHKKTLDAFMISKGFIKYKANAYVRLNSINILENINLQKERYGSKTFTVNVALMPLYIPTEFITFAIDRRLGELIDGSDAWWDFADDKAAQVSFENIIQAIDRYALPWFDTYNDQTYVKDDLIKRTSSGRASRYNEEWLAVIDLYDSSEDVIKEHMQKLKLPKKLIG